MDVLADLLSRANARGALFAETTVHGEDWAFRFDEPMRFGVHIVLAGSLIATHADGSSVRATAGDLVAVRTQAPNGTAQPHDLSGGSRTHRVERFDDVLARPDVLRTSRSFRVGGTGPATTFVCGAYRFDGDLCGRLLDELPSVFVVPSTPGTALRAAIDLLVLELRQERPGQQAVLDRLIDVVLICALREHLDRSARRPAWYGALSDPHLGRTLEAVHAAPAAPHTVASLAKVAGLSRAAFAQRFTGTVGMTPMGYVTGWRLALAREQLRDSDRPLDAIARSVGYGSAYSLSAAFKRTTGTAPGSWRAQQRAAAH